MDLYTEGHIGGLLLQHYARGKAKRYPDLNWHACNVNMRDVHKRNCTGSATKCWLHFDKFTIGQHFLISHNKKVDTVLAHKVFDGI